MLLTPTQKRIKKQLDKGTLINSDMLNDLIQDHSQTKVTTKGLYERYKASAGAVPIFSREFDGANKINSQINNDFFSEIIDVKQGYLIGKPIVYQLDKNKYENRETEYLKHQEFMSNLITRNNFQDLDAELVKIVSICGHAGREIFIDGDGEVRIVNLMPYETIFLTNVFGQVDYAVRYYDEQNENGDTVTMIEFFDKERVLYFEGTKGDYQCTDESVHLFGQCPVIKVINNEEEIGDCDKVLPLIDAYDRTLSDISSEIEQFRLAYMYFKGKEPTAEVIEASKQTGGFYVGEDGEVGFITKSINDAVVEHHLDRLADNILRFAKSVNFGDEQFAGNLSGVAMKYKLFALESKSSVMESKLQTALRNQFKIVCNLLNIQNINVNYLDIFFEFTRNLPINLQDEAQANATLMGLVSERTRLSLLPFVDDVDYELEQMELDKEVDPYSDYEVDTPTIEAPEVESNQVEVD